MLPYLWYGSKVMEDKRSKSYLLGIEAASLRYCVTGLKKQQTDKTLMDKIELIG